MKMKMKIKSMLFRFNCNKRTQNVFVISWHEKNVKIYLLEKDLNSIKLYLSISYHHPILFYVSFSWFLKKLFCQITKKNSKLAIWYMRVSYFKVISLFMYQLSRAVNEICRYDVSVGSKYRNAQEMFSNIQRWREQKNTHIPFMSVMNGWQW